MPFEEEQRPKKKAVGMRPDGSIILASADGKGDSEGDDSGPDSEKASHRLDHDEVIRLHRGGVTVNELAERFNVTPAAINYHLRDMDKPKHKRKEKNSNTKGRKKKGRKAISGGVEIVPRSELNINDTIIADSIMSKIDELDDSNAIRYECADVEEAELVTQKLQEILEEQKREDEYQIYTVDDKIVAVLRK